jgi:hypothetical protein
MVMGGKDSMAKLLDVFQTKLEDSECKVLFDGLGERPGIKTMEGS